VETDQAPVLITVEDLARHLGISTMSVYRLVEAGRLPHYRAGRQIRFRLEEALEALREEGP